MSGVLRAHAALNEAGLASAGRLTRATNSDQVWFVGPYVLRLGLPGDRRHTLRHEKNVLQALAPVVPVPEVLDYGQASFGEWLVVRRVPGKELSRMWPVMNERERQQAMTTLGHALRRLHQVDAATAGLDARAPGSERRINIPHQLPAGRLLEVLARAALLPHVDSAVISDAAALVKATASVLDEDSTTLVHGDLHFENVLWDGDKLTAIIDWEFARPGPPDLDLDVLLHSLADPALHVGADYAGTVSRKDYEHVAGWLRGVYPELFAHPRLAERLTIYRIAYDTRALIQDPPNGPAELLSPHHPYRRLQRVVSGRSDLAWVMATLAAS